MNFVALVSGGKDSIYSILECCRLGHTLLGCVHLGAAVGNPPDEESYMYQSAASEALVTLVEECLGVPLIHYRRVGKSINTSLVYQEALAGDEVEDLYRALQLAKETFPSVQAVSSGAILSTYQRIRIEHVCSRLELTSLSYLWRAAPQHDLLDRMIRDGIVAVLVRAACPPGLKPRNHLNKTLQELQPLFLKLNQLYQFHVCGEGGEYESLVLDCPLYKKRLVLDETQIVELEGDEGVGVLKIIKCHAEDKEKSDDVMMNNNDMGLDGTSAVKEQSSHLPPTTNTTTEKTMTTESSCPSPTLPTVVVQDQQTIRFLPSVKFVGGGLWHVSEIMVPALPAANGEEATSEAELAVQEARIVLGLLGALVKKHGCTAQDVLFVHLYLSEISHFANINAYYREFFGTLLPPSRSCVAIGRHVLPGGRRVSLDCMVQCGSGNYLRGKRGGSPPYADAALDNTSSQLRHVLHVQSISHWAPVCVGPYSQVNTLRSSLHFMAGQIGLKPATMTLHSNWKDQLRQCWTNLASVLDALEGGSLEQIMSGVVYVADHVYFGMDGPGNENCGQNPAIVDLESICLQEMEHNGGIVAGKVDSPIATAENHEYGDDNDETLKSPQKDATCPLLVVSIPEMPLGAVVEVEVIAATKQASSCLSREDTAFHLYINESSESIPTKTPRWDVGYDFPLADTPECCIESRHRVQISVHRRSMGGDAAVFATVTAQVITEENLTTNTIDLDPFEMLSVMVNTALSDRREASTRPRLTDALHVRLFYVASTIVSSTGAKLVNDDGTCLRSSLQTALASHFQSVPPASSVVPVQAINQLYAKNSLRVNAATSPNSILMAMQVLLLNPILLETELWVHHGRQ